MELKINNKGQIFYKKRRKELFMFFYTFPFFISIISILFILGAKNKLHLYFSALLLGILTILVLFAIISIMKNLNRTICMINIDDSKIKIKSFSILFLKSKELILEKDDIKLVPNKFHISKKEKEEGWKLEVFNYEFSLIRCFFNPNLLDVELLRKIGHPPGTPVRMLL